MSIKGAKLNVNRRLIVPFLDTRIDSNCNNIARIAKSNDILRYTRCAHNACINNAREVHHKAPERFLRRSISNAFPHLGVRKRKRGGDCEREREGVHRTFLRDFAIRLAVTGECRNSSNSAENDPRATLRADKRRDDPINYIGVNPTRFRDAQTEMDQGFSKSCIQMRGSSRSRR